MTLIPLCKGQKNKDILLYLKMYTVLFIIFIISFLLLAYPDRASEGIRYGIRLCLEKLIPALFPFMILSSFLIRSRVYKALALPFGKLTSKLFRLPDKAIPVILMSLIGGYPIGAIMTKALYEKNEITYDDAKQLMAFSSNPSISFCIGFIGSTLYKSIGAGLLVYLSSVIPSLFIGILYGRLKKAVPLTALNKHEETKVSLSSAFTEAISESTAAITAICVTVTVFSCILELTEAFTSNTYILSVASFFLEVTNFTEKNFRLLSVYIISASASFGGFCTHFQILPYLLKMKISYKHFVFYRLISTVASYFISTALFSLFPEAVSASSVNQSKAMPSKAGISVSFILLIMSAIIILTDNALQKIRAESKNIY